MPILFGDIATSMGLMALAALPYFAGKRWSFLPWVGFMAGVLSSLLSGTRGGWGAVLLCLAPLYIYRRVALNRTNLVIFGFGLVLLVAAVMTPRLGVSDRIEEITADIEQYEQGNSNSPSGARLELWRGAWKLFMAHPLEGVGRENFNHGLKSLIVRGELNADVGIYRHAHNEFLRALATEGVIGGAALLLIYLAPLMFFLRAMRGNG